MAIHDAILTPEINLATVEKIIESNPECLRSVNLVSSLTPLQAAAGRTHSRLIRLLVARGAELEDRGQRGATPFLIACQVCGYVYTCTCTLVKHWPVSNPVLFLMYTHCIRKWMMGGKMKAEIFRGGLTYS